MGSMLGGYGRQVNAQGGGAVLILERVSSVQNTVLALKTQDSFGAIPSRIAPFLGLDH